MSEAPVIELIHAEVAPEAEPERVILRDVTWSIREGECWVVCGSPASGKSTLLAVAAGLNPRADGEVRIFGLDPARTSESEQAAWRREIGYVFESGGNLIGSLSVADNVSLSLRYHEDLDPEEARERVESLLARANLERVAHLLPSRLGAGLRHRVALLRALVRPVRALFLDDPLRGLAPSSIRWWLGFLGELRAEAAAAGRPIAVAATTYDFRPWIGAADHFAVIDGDRFRVLENAEEAEAYREDHAVSAPPAVGA